MLQVEYDTIPIVTVSHNNFHYLKFMVDQIREAWPNRPLIVMDNQSKDPQTKEYLRTLDATIIYNETNYGPRINPCNHAKLYRELPEKFLVTDPDIQFPENMPQDIIQILCEISERYRAEKVGFALDISEPELMYDIPDYFMGRSLIDWELQFWENPIETTDRWTVYRAEIDTTFCLVNKRYEGSQVHIRIGGSGFTAKHLPWYRENGIVNRETAVQIAKNQSGGDSTIARYLIYQEPK
jgi:hypothetical protein